MNPRLINVAVENETDVFTGQVFVHKAAGRGALWPPQFELHEAADVGPMDPFRLDPSLLLLQESQYDLENLYCKQIRLK